MNIKIDDTYSIKSDFRNIILVEDKIFSDGEQVGEHYDFNVGYYGTLQHALKDYLRIKINTSDATSFKQLIKEIQDTRKIIEKVLEVEEIEQNFTSWKSSQRN